MLIIAILEFIDSLLWHKWQWYSLFTLRYRLKHDPEYKRFYYMLHAALLKRFCELEESTFLYGTNTKE